MALDAEDNTDSASTSSGSPVKQEQLQYDYSLDKAVEIFEKLVIGGAASTSTSCSKPDSLTSSCSQTNPQSTTKGLSSQPPEPPKPRYRRYRWRPYSLPSNFIVRKQRFVQGSLVPIRLRIVRWKGDVDVNCLKYSLLGDKKSIPCAVEAARPPTPDGEVEELAEYFSHFVRVGLKMSALAESMYC